MKTSALCILLLSICFEVYSQNDSLKSYTTARIQGEPPKIDGLLNDPAWDQVEWGGGDFRQLQPDAGKAPTVQTYFKIMYDDKNLYVIFRNLDPEPDKIVKRMSRRDGFEGDWVEINIDSYYDKRTAFSFTSSVSGVKGDEYVSNNGDNWDASWDPIWYLKTSINAEGWIAELRIPLSQLRFADKPELTWGFQVHRRFFRNQERSLWQYIPPTAPGWVYLFGDLKGIKGIKPQKQLEIQPYVVAKTETFAKEEGNPFATGQGSDVEFGLDAKIGITSDITLDLTVNPDFGQVEADPSQVNLSAFELFFQERRPFFIEGSNVLNFPASNSNSNNLFYSRRIGRSPQGWVSTDEAGDDGVNEYVTANRQSTILGAAKLTGKNKNGFSWGILETVTGAERAEIDSLGHRRKQIIEPVTNYFVARAQQDIQKGKSLIGGMFTATNRDITDPRLKWLHDDAYSGGIDFVHNWKERKYFVSGKVFASHVRGSTTAISATQLSSERYFQRPDNHHTEFDPTRTSLTGTGGSFVGGKQSGKVVFNLGYSWLSPELELNDIGFLSQTDLMSQFAWVQYRVVTPVSIFRSQRYNINQWLDYDFGGKNLGRGFNFNNHLEFKNFYFLSFGATYNTHGISNADLRGGPAIRYPGNANMFVYIGSDSRKKFAVQANFEKQWGVSSYSQYTYADLQFRYRPINAIDLSITPSIYLNQNELQYVATGHIGSDPRYIVGNLDQTVARVTIRATGMITPNLSLQYWGQPFGTAGAYNGYKNITNASADEYGNRFTHMNPAAMSLSGGVYSVDENSNGSVDYSFGQPDFNFGQFRSNLVLRWEYIPGSTFFLVWTQEVNGAFYDRGGRLDQRYKFDFDQKGHNIFLLKYTYRFVL
jgi:hypothetical protein